MKGQGWKCCSGIWFELPKYTDRVRNCPPKDKNYDEHEGFIAWNGGSFDPEEFDVVVTDQALRSR